MILYYIIVYIFTLYVWIYLVFAPKSRFGYTLPRAVFRQDIKLSSLPRPSFLPPEFWEVWFVTVVGVGLGSLKRSTCALHYGYADMLLIPNDFSPTFQKTWRMTFDSWYVCFNWKGSMLLDLPWKHVTPQKGAAVASPEGFVWCCKIQGVCSTRSPAVWGTYWQLFWIWLNCFYNNDILWFCFGHGLMTFSLPLVIYCKGTLFLNFKQNSAGQFI